MPLKSSSNGFEQRYHSILTYSLHRVNLLICLKLLPFLAPTCTGCRAMQAISNSQKSTQRRSPVVENPSQALNSSQPAPATRSSSGSARSSTYKGKNVRSVPAPMCPAFYVYAACLNGDLLTVCGAVAVSTIITDREECYPSFDSHKATARNTHAMVKAHGKRRAGLRRVCSPRIRVQHRLPGVHGDWG